MLTGRTCTTELALPQTPLVALLLRAKIQDLRLEIEEIREQLEEDQDPDRMSDIQELIGVRCTGGAAVGDGEANIFLG